MGRRSRRTSAAHPLLWLLAGVVAGLGLAGTFWWLRQPTRAPSEEALRALVHPLPKAGQAHPDRPPPAAPPASSSPYAFYHLLPRMEVVVPEEELGAARRGTAPARAGNEAARYELQVGAFRTHRQADALKARLALLGFEARIQRIRTAQGTWHRVRLGPFASLREVD
ncbi:MAG: hypothetical protein D6721_03085, partial [Gammaproteobacteria bacterium]